MHGWLVSLELIKW